MTEYEIKLADARWKKRAAQIRARDNYTCQRCGEKRRPLEVHHREYLPKRDPWEYADEFLVTVCDLCHDQISHALVIDEGMTTPPFSARNFSKEQFHRMVDGMIWINRNAAAAASALRVWLLRHATDDPAGAVERIESFVEAHKT